MFAGFFPAKVDINAGCKKPLQIVHKNHMMAYVTLDTRQGFAPFSDGSGVLVQRLA
jgi:hypothetical protein